ncbi:RHS repeat-associated core domain-containing protein [Serratia marcescens]|uniref:RHS repeat-associated core domain-containing protein n=1 Tax=Serratia marcescens TaxID=615 RepID=UPI003C12C63D
MTNQSEHLAASTLDSPLGFNGERTDPALGSYHLGNGYRLYNPTLRRFTAPDDMSPFGAGGINPYAYCEGDPINNTDPTGHMLRPEPRHALGDDAPEWFNRIRMITEDVLTDVLDPELAITEDVERAAVNKSEHIATHKAERVPTSSIAPHGSTVTPEAAPGSSHPGASDIPPRSVGRHQMGPLRSSGSPGPIRPVNKGRRMRQLVDIGWLKTVDNPAVPNSTMEVIRNPVTRNSNGRLVVQLPDGYEANQAHRYTNGLRERRFRKWNASTGNHDSNSNLTEDMLFKPDPDDISTWYLEFRRIPKP